MIFWSCTVAVMALVLGGLAALVIDADAKRLARYGRNIFAGFAAAFAIFSTIRVVDAGHVGVQVLFGNVRRATLAEGIHLVNPFIDIIEMSTRVQRMEGEYNSASRDMQTVHTKMVINYQLRAADAATVYQKVGEGYAQTIIDPACQEVLKAESAKHVASEILHNRSEIKLRVQNTLANWVGKYGFALREVAIANISFDPAYAKAIENKQVQEQLAEQKRYELVRAQREAEIVAAKAKGEADAAIAMAIGAAEAMRLRGTAEAAYNRKVAESLTPTLIQQQYLGKWDGALPQYMLGSGAGALIQLPAGSR